MFFRWLPRPKTSVGLLLVSAILLLFTLLGVRELWTQEHRWADIVLGMFYRQDFFHPFLGTTTYYDKPLLSYWFIAFVAKLTGELNTWSLRFPSALAGLFAVYAIYRLGTRLKNQRMGLLAGWMLLTTFYFIFWARTSSADMLNMAGTLIAVAWYFEKRDNASFLDFAIFFLILAVTALCKGLVGPVIALLVIFPDLLYAQRWKKYLRLSILLSVLPAAVIYCLPFWASVHFSGEHYGQNGLYLVYRENILRYFQPFDHQGPIYTYLIFLPVYLFPWTLFFIPALISLKARWSTMTIFSKWIVWALFLGFLFFTLSGSRRNYYVLPLVPFAILLTADWLESSKYLIWAKRVLIAAFIGMFVNFIVLQPLYYAKGGPQRFAVHLKKTLIKTKPWSDWQFVLLDPESKITFYLKLSPLVKSYDISGPRQLQTEASLKDAWQTLKNQHNKNIIFISRKQYEPFLTALLKDDYNLMVARPNLGEKLLHVSNDNLPIAYIHK
jgi:4-amino-4-deoxy-L-arabinose transferase-like glycosyltransferase